MDIRTDAGVESTSQSTSSSSVYAEGITAGVLGAVAVALWFLLVDIVNGHPFFTPTVLGTALFRGGAGLDSPETLPISFEMVTVFTWIHLLVFAVLGGVAARLLAVAERAPNAGFGILLLFVIFEFGFIALSMTAADRLLHTLGAASVFVGNLLAAAVMVAYFRWRHPSIRILP